MQTNPVDECTVMYMFNRLPVESQLTLLSDLFSSYLTNVYSLTVPKDFLCNAANAMLRLSDGGRTNVLYHLAKGIGTLRADKKDSRFPVKRMPMGLVEYIAQFFAVDNLQQVCKKQYIQNPLIVFSDDRFLVQLIIVYGNRLCIASLG